MDCSSVNCFPFLCISCYNDSDEFIEEVETLIKIPKYREMTWRLVGGKMNLILNGAKGRAHWKEDLRDFMDINK